MNSQLALRTLIDIRLIKQPPLLVEIRLHQCVHISPSCFKTYTFRIFKNEDTSEVKLCLVLKQALRYADVWRSGWISPHILNLGTRSRWVVSFQPLSLCPIGKNPSTHLRGGWVGFRVDLDVIVKRGDLLPCRESSSGRPTCSLDTVHWLGCHIRIKYLEY